MSFAAGLIAAGVHDVMIGAGVEHMGRLPMGSNVAHADEFGTPFPPELMDRYELVPQGISAELIAEHWEIPRSEQDELGLRSHQLAARATDEGRFEREIIPMQVDGQTFATDQGIRRDTSLEALAALKPAFKEDGTRHGRQLLADLRRRRGGAADVTREGGRARPDAAGADLRRDDRRRRPGDHAHRPDPRDSDSCSSATG